MEEAEATLEASQQAEFSEGRSMVSLEATELMEGASGSDEWKPGMPPTESNVTDQM